MTVGELKELLEDFDDEMEVRIGMAQRYGTDFANEIDDVEEHRIRAFYGSDYKAVVLREGSQVGAVDWDDEDLDYEEEEWEDDYED